MSNRRLAEGQQPSNSVGRVSESRVDSCQWPTSGIGVALRRSDDWPFSTGPQAIGLISGFYTQVEVVPASLARELEAELRVATDETQTEAKPESLKEEPSAAAEPAAARSVSEGEGLAARIEELIEVVKGIDETVGSFGYSLGLLNVEGSAGDLEDLEMVLDEAEKLADRARSLLVHKEEA